LIILNSDILISEKAQYQQTINKLLNEKSKLEEDVKFYKEKFESFNFQVKSLENKIELDKNAIFCITSEKDQLEINIKNLKEKINELENSLNLREQNDNAILLKNQIDLFNLENNKSNHDQYY
jgi:hypothetical protein